MEPHVQYARTSDDISIAFWAIGEGPAFVSAPPAFSWSHVGLEWQIDDWRHWYEHLMETMRVVRYDGRGTGLSDRDVPPPGLEGSVRDLEAVVDRLGIERFALFGCYWSVPIAIAYAARHPDRVSHLILWCGFSRADDARGSEELMQVIQSMLAVDYRAFTLTLAHTVFGWQEGEAANALAQYMRESIDADRVQAHWDANENIDVDDELDRIQAPTLIFHRRDFTMLNPDVPRRLASGIPNARLQMLEGASVSPYMGDMAQIVDVINDFVGTGGRALRTTHAHQPEAQDARSGAGFRTIMFTDIEGSTALTQRLGDARAQEIVRLHDTIVGSALYAQGGSRVKHTGDGIMASFPTASGALECAVAIQRAFLAHNTAHPADGVQVRIGINAGEPVAEGDDLFGTAVQIASRVCASAEAGEILASDVVRQLVAGKGFLFADRGDTELRGFEDPVRVYEVRWHEDSA